MYTHTRTRHTQHTHSHTHTHTTHTHTHLNSYKQHFVSDACTYSLLIFTSRLMRLSYIYLIT